MGVYDTAQLKSLLSVLDDDVNIKLTKLEKQAINMIVKNNSTSGNSVSVNYTLSDLSVIPEPPALKKIPMFGTSIKIDSQMIDKFIKGKSALQDTERFTIVKTDEGCQIVIGYSATNTNRVSIPALCHTCDLEKNLSFPDMVIYLQSDTERLIRNIKKRGRIYEEKIDIGYLEALNQVKRRAAGLDPNTADASVDVTTATVNDIVTEKGWELAGENKRWFDLIRTETLEDAIAKRDPNEQVPLVRQPTKDQYITPLPAEAIATSKLTQSSVKNSFATGLTLSQEDALRAQIFGCWSVPLGLPYDENLLVRIKLKLKKDGTIMKSEILDHQRMNKPGQKFYKVLAESALRAVRLCQPLKVPPTGYDKWKDLQLNFNPTEMLKG